MHRKSPVRVATLVFVIFTLAAPAFAAPFRDDSPVGIFERAITRVVKQIRRIFLPTPDTQLQVVKP